MATKQNKMTIDIEANVDENKAKQEGEKLAKSVSKGASKKQNAETSSDATNYQNLTKKELLEKANYFGIKGASKLNKADLIKALNKNYTSPDLNGVFKLTDLKNPLSKDELKKTIYAMMHFDKNTTVGSLISHSDTTDLAEDAPLEIRDLVKTIRYEAIDGVKNLVKQIATQYSILQKARYVEDEEGNNHKVFDVYFTPTVTEKAVTKKKTDEEKKAEREERKQADFSRDVYKIREKGKNIEAKKELEKLTQQNRLEVQAVKSKNRQEQIEIQNKAKLETIALREKQAQERSEQARLYSLFKIRAVMSLISRVMKVMLNTTKQVVLAFSEAEVKTHLMNNAFKDSNFLLKTSLETTEKLGASITEVANTATSFYTTMVNGGFTVENAQTMAYWYTQVAGSFAKIAGTDLSSVTGELESFMSSGQLGTRLSSSVKGGNTSATDTSIKSWAVSQGFISSIGDTLKQSELSAIRLAWLLSNLDMEKLENSSWNIALLQKEIASSLANIKTHLGDIINIPAKVLLSTVAFILKGVDRITSLIAEAPPVFKAVVGFANTLVVLTGAIGLGVVFITMLLRKDGVLMHVLGVEGKTILATTALTVGYLMAVVGVVGGIALAVGAISSLRKKSTKETQAETEALKEQTEELNDQLQAYDELNLLKGDSFDTGSYNDFMNKYINEDGSFNLEGLDASVIDEMSTAFDNMSTAMKVATAVFGTLLTVASAYFVVTKAGVVWEKLMVGIQTARNLLHKKSAVNKGLDAIATNEQTRAETKHIAMVNMDTTTQMANNAVTKQGIILKRLLWFGVGGALVAGTAVTAITLANQNQTKSANGNYFGKASSTIIGEKYPEVAIPLGQSPQYADMKQSIADSVVESLGRQGGSSQPIQNVVNVQIGDKKFTDYVFEAVDNGLRHKYGTTFNKLANNRR